METDYSEAGRNLVADLVSKLGGGWWGENVNKMDCLYTDPDTGRQQLQLYAITVVITKYKTLHKQWTIWDSGRFQFYNFNNGKPWPLLHM